MSKKQKKMLLKIIIALVLTAIIRVMLIFVPMEYSFMLGKLEIKWLQLILFLIPYIVVGSDIVKKAFKGIKNRQVCDENFLMAVATIGAFALGEFFEGVAVILFYQIGELFQSYAVGKSRRNISELMDIRPDYAMIERDGELVSVDPDEVEIGSIIVIRPGDKIPLDGIIEEGRTTINTCAITGESVPRTVDVGDEVISGCVNLSGAIKVRTTTNFGESTAAKILDLVENASSRKSKSENFIGRFAKIYTPAVCIGALLLAVLPPLFMLIIGNDPQWFEWVYRGLTFLVISCPCALVISIPLTFFAGIGGAGKAGVLIKGSNYLELLSKTKYILFDKTGTVTQGVFEVAGLHHNEMENDELLEIAAKVEANSNHPIAKSIVAAYGKKVDFSDVSDYEETFGYGITAKVGEDFVAIGNHRLMEKYNVDYVDCHSVGTVVHVAINDKYAGHILISDIVKSNSKLAIERLKKLGMKKLTMLTGDKEAVAKDVCDKLAIEDYHSSLLPEDKVTWIEKTIEEKNEKDIVAFVGDGINDAPVLSRADIGIAMGGLGADAAIEAADVVLMDDDPLKISKAIGISQKCMRIVYENIGVSLGIKAICLILGAFGIANMWMAIFADVGVMVIAVLNAIRALKVSNI